MNPNMNLNILFGCDGGYIVYETVNAGEFNEYEQRLVFGGNLDEATKYLNARMAAMVDENAKRQNGEPRQIEAPVKIRVRRTKEPQPVDVLEALEMAEDVA
jgi:hypothetical protein